MTLRTWKVGLALRNLTDDKRRLAVSVAGITLAVVLMFMQVGFRNALLDSMVETIRRLNGDVILAHPMKPSFNIKQPFPRSRLYEARGYDGVEAAYALYMESLAATWKNPQEGSERDIRVLAFDPQQPVLLVPEIEAQAELLERPDTVLMDEKSKAFYGPREVGVTTELAGRKVELVGTFTLGTDFFNDGAVVMSDRNFARFFPGPPGIDPLSEVELGLLKVRPGTDVPALVRALNAALPDDVEVYSKRDYLDKEMEFWRATTPIGYVFGLGAVMGFVVGVVICYQVLYADVNDRLAEFATLKAMGYQNRFLVGVVMRQALYLAFFGFIAGIVASTYLYGRLAETTGLLMRLTPWRVLGVFLFTVLMCVISGCMAVRRALSADPAELFG